MPSGEDDALSVLHVITDLNPGGAERMLLRLLQQLDPRDIRSQVVSLSDIGVVGKQLLELGFDVEAIGMTPGRPNPNAVRRLVALIRRRAPDLVQTWMYHGDLVGGVAARLAGTDKVLWNIRHGGLPSTGTKRSTVLTIRACAALSKYVPSRIVCCAESARRAHVDLGYDDARMAVIPNGYDLSHWRPDEAARTESRRALDLGNDVVVGILARYHPDKDIPTFLATAGTILGAIPSARMVMCGQGLEPGNADLARLVTSAGLDGRVTLLGYRSDTHRILPTFDVLVSSSRVEGFPNVVAEAMASGVPCVVTDVGDSATIVGETGLVVPAEAPEQLASACVAILKESIESRRERGRSARQRIEQHYSIEAVANRYASLYREVFGREAGTGHAR